MTRLKSQALFESRLMSRSLTTNYLINTIGSILPLCISIFTVPVYVLHIGDARYGVLSIVWVLLGYFGFLDLGLSRAAANSLARLKDASQQERAEVVVTTLFLNFGMGLLGSFVLAIAGNYLLQNVLNIPEDLKPELKAAFPWIVGLFPLALVSGVGIGALEARESFFQANLFQVVGTSLGQLVPMLLAVGIGPSLNIIIPAAALARGLTVLVTLMAVYRQEGPLRPRHFSRTQIAELLRYGGWVSVSGVISPILTSLDQFVIGSILGVAAVAHYSIPMNLVMRSQVIAAALERTIFPRLSHFDIDTANSLARNASTNLASAFAVIIYPAIFILKPFMNAWLGVAFVDNTNGIGQILLVGAWINGLAFVPGGLIQARGRPHITATFHCCELGPFVFLLWLLAHSFGLKGVAVAWVARVSIDTCLMYAFSGFLNRALTFRLLSLFLIMIAAVAIESLENWTYVERILLAIGFALPALAIDISSARGLIRSMRLPHKKLRWILSPKQ